MISVFFVVALKPTRTDTEHKPTFTDVVNGPRHVCQQLRIAISETRNQRTNLRVASVGGHRRKQRITLEVRRLGVARQRIKMIPCPNAVDAHRIGFAPRGTHIFDICGLWPKLYTYFHSQTIQLVLVRRRIANFGGQSCASKNHFSQQH